MGAALGAATLPGCGCRPKVRKDPPNTLHLPAGERVQGLDPGFADDLFSGIEASRAYEGLLQYHYLKRPYSLVPNLAESMPEVSPDGLTYVFRLKKGVLFQDDPCFRATGGKGRELTAEDVIYSFKRLADPKVGATAWWVLDGRIEGLNEWRQAAAESGRGDYAAVVSGLRALDRFTVQIRLTRKSSQFLYALAMPATSIVPPEAAEYYREGLRLHPVGTGPFRLESFSPDRITWVRNPTYRRETYPSDGAPEDQAKGLLEDAGKTLPLAEKVVVHVFAGKGAPGREEDPQWRLFQEGKLDYVELGKEGFEQSITAAKELDPGLAKKGVKLAKSARLDVTFEAFNMADPVIGKNGALRRALSLALQADSMIDLFHGGRALPAQGPIPPGLAGHDPAYRNPYRQFNLVKAKELLAQAGFPEGQGLPPIEYAALAGTATEKMAEYVERSFGEIGVKLTISRYEWEAFHAAIRAGKAQMWGSAWLADYPDAETFLQLFYGRHSGSPNDSRYRNPEFDRVFELALALPEGPQRAALYRDLSRMVAEDVPWIFGVHRVTYGLAQPWLRNYKQHDFDRGAAKYLRVAK